MEQLHCLVTIQRTDRLTMIEKCCTFKFTLKNRFEYSEIYKGKKRKWRFDNKRHCLTLLRQVYTTDRMKM